MKKPLPSTDRLEEALIAVILGVMTLVTFANVIARYVFNDNILWALELTVFLFGWLVLLGASYEVKKNAHLGVDLLIETCSLPQRRMLALISVGVCIAFGFLMLKGAWDYWANFANLPKTTGRWLPLGFEEEFRPKGWYEVNDIPMPAALDWLSGIFNDGQEYEKIPRLIPYVILPASMGLLLLRLIQAAQAVWNGRSDRIVASHDVQDDVGDARRGPEEQG